MDTACFLHIERGDGVLIASASLSDIFGFEYLPGNLSEFLLLYSFSSRR